MQISNEEALLAYHHIQQTISKTQASLVLLFLFCPVVLLGFLPLAHWVLRVSSYLSIRN
jgi:hypothetical protein